MFDMLRFVLYSVVVLVDILLMIVIRYIGSRNQCGEIVSNLLMQLFDVMNVGVFDVMIVVVVRLKKNGMKVVICVVNIVFIM